DVEALREAFARLAGSEETKGLRYLVALLLLRKKALRLVETRRGERDEPDQIVVSAGKGKTDRIEVVVPVLSAETLDSLRSQLRSLLGIEESEARDPAPEQSGDRGSRGAGGEIGGILEEKSRGTRGEHVSRSE